jgi:hypothetical protein
MVNNQVRRPAMVYSPSWSMGSSRDMAPAAVGPESGSKPSFSVNRKTDAPRYCELNDWKEGQERVTAHMKGRLCVTLGTTTRSS